MCLESEFKGEKHFFAYSIFSFSFSFSHSLRSKVRSSDKQNWKFSRKKSERKKKAQIEEEKKLQPACVGVNLELERRAQVDKSALI